MANAFVAGATGYTGREVVRELIRQGVHAIAHVRPDSANRAEWSARFTAMGALVDHTPWDEKAMTESLARYGPGQVFALLGTTRARAQRAAQQGADASYHAVDYGLTALLLRATVKAVPRARFVYLSAIGVSGPSRNPYMDVRWRMESEIRDTDLDYIIARPSFITGTDRAEKRTAERIGAAVIDKALGWAAALGMRRLRARYASMTGSQLALALVTAALRPEARVVLETDALRIYSKS